jgi:hypothetical protein
VQLRHARQLLELDALERVGVGLRRALGGDLEGELAGRVPPEAALALEQLRQVAEERDALEGVAVAGVEGAGGGHHVAS